MNVTFPTWQEPRETLAGVLNRLRREQPDRNVLYTVTTVRGDFACAATSIEDLVQSAESAAGALTSLRVCCGERVIVSVADARVALAWFLGALGCGVLPVIVPPLQLPLGGARGVERTRSVVANCAPALAVTDAEGGRALRPQALRLVPAALVHEMGHRIALREQPLDTAAFLQYTSGSTNAPKGVVITQRNLVANLAAISGAIGVSRQERMFSWLPLHHDMGLVGGVLWPIFAGGATYVMDPMLFMVRPSTWLRAMTHVRATITVAPNFAYAICAGRLKDEHLTGVDLSSVRLALNGAEPVDSGVVKAFERRFGQYGLRGGTILPVYGLAESTLAVAFSDVGTGATVDHVDRKALATVGRAVRATSGDRCLPVVAVGRAVPGHSVEIVQNSNGRGCEERCVGEVVVRGPSVSPRYWGNPETTRRESLATGDLGYIADGLLYVVDRIKDLIIIGGENYAPSDLEMAASRVSGVRAGRVVAFGMKRAGHGTQCAVVVAELDLRRTVDPESVRRAVCSTVCARVGVSPIVVLVAPGSVAKTTSGKVRRRYCAQQFELGTLKGIENVADVRALRWRAAVRRVLGHVAAFGQMYRSRWRSSRREGTDT
jgi:acyl-CoA synthetase (AMP-forming)/AMP-acid ligase II